MTSNMLGLDRFEALTTLCDGILIDPDAPEALLDAPALHVVSSHPALIRTQLHEPDGVAARARNLARHIRNVLKPGGRIGLETGRRYDMLLIGGVVSAAHLDAEADFYFGGLQAHLFSAGLSSLLLLRNQTGLPTRTLAGRGHRGGEQGRQLLPDALSAREEMSFIRKAVAARGASRARLERVGDRVLRRNLADDISSPSTTGNLRLEALVRRACAAVEPAAVITMFEGHAWERCVFRAASEHSPEIVRVGYQHTIVRKHAHGIRRSLGHGMDPDVVLCMGPTTCTDLAENSSFEDTRFCVFGTHRMQRDPGATVRAPGDTCLVVPEGLQDEASSLFRMAMEAARLSPETRFIFRCHPVLPYDSLIGLPAEDQLPPGVELSRVPNIEDDFDRSSSILYRGSSSVVYGILSGLRPFYLEMPDELTLDPLHALATWRERVFDAQSFLDALAADRREPEADRAQGWDVARGFCANMSVAERAEGLSDLIERVR
ncbi:MAG: hypothetical protein P8L30_08790 [Longimicrobiales bacterium]|nr:hypothetical protein [Longimicrobiales bacterium]